MIDTTTIPLHVVSGTGVSMSCNQLAEHKLPDMTVLRLISIREPSIDRHKKAVKEGQRCPLSQPFDFAGKFKAEVLNDLIHVFPCLDKDMVLIYMLTVSFHFGKLDKLDGVYLSD